MLPKTTPPSTLRPRSPKPRGISRKVTIGMAAAGAAAVIGVLAFDPGFSMIRDRPADTLPVLSNVKPDLSMLPSDYSQPQTASMAVPGGATSPPALDLPPPPAPPHARPAVGPSAPKRRKVRAGIAVGGDDGLGDTGQGQAPGVQMVADMQQSAAGQENSQKPMATVRG